MSMSTMIDDSESASKMQEVARACTVIEVPQTELYGMRLYKRDSKTHYIVAAAELYSKQLAQKIGIKAIKNDESKLSEFKSKIAEFTDVTALLVADPKTTSAEQNHRERFESQVSGPDIAAKFDFISSLLGKPVSPENVFKPGEYIDIASVTQGKGWQGVIKRYGTARLSHKATQKVRHTGTMGSFGYRKVMYTVPQYGGMGFNYRTERNKRILKMGSAARAAEVNKLEGFKNYGTIRSAYLVISGSVPGPSKRLVRLRQTLGGLNAKGVKEPKITSIR